MTTSSNVAGGQRSAPKDLGGTAVTMHLEVPNRDAAVDRAVAAGAAVIMPPSDTFGAARDAMVLDPFGHSWSFAHPLPSKQS